MNDATEIKRKRGDKKAWQKNKEIKQGKKRAQWAHMRWNWRIMCVLTYSIICMYVCMYCNIEGGMQCTQMITYHYYNIYATGIVHMRYTEWNKQALQRYLMVAHRRVADIDTHANRSKWKATFVFSSMSVIFSMLCFLCVSHASCNEDNIVYDVQIYYVIYMWLPLQMYATFSFIRNCRVYRNATSVRWWTISFKEQHFYAHC